MGTRRWVGALRCTLQDASQAMQKCMYMYMEQKLHAALRVLVEFADLEDDFELSRAILLQAEAKRKKKTHALTHGKQNADRAAVHLHVSV